MNFFINALVSWKTTIGGVAVIALVLLKWANNRQVDWEDLPLIIGGFTGVAAKDNNVTGAVK